QELLSSKQESYESLSILASFALEAQLYTTVKQYFTKLQHYPLTQEALDLMSRYKTSSGDEEFVVPSPSGTLLNKDELKFTCPACLNTTQAFFFQCTSCAKIGTLCS
ncbi:MAG TPA: hypothetical protein VI959_05480, partial [Alphaproteobacteria bacterium]|nr:hypothetical protein [Alphaproteobacteria bacterium]